MWKTYGNGVAVFSRFDLLKAQLAPMLDNIMLGIVRYGEKDMTGYNFIRFLYTKRRLFERERERRVVIQCYDPVGGANRHYNLNSFPNREPLDELNPLHPWVHECKRRRIDLKALLTEVRLSPWATTEESEEVKLRVRGKNFPGPVTPLDLRSPLTPTLDELRRHVRKADLETVQERIERGRGNGRRRVPDRAVRAGVNFPGESGCDLRRKFPVDPDV